MSTKQGLFYKNHERKAKCPKCLTECTVHYRTIGGHTEELAHMQRRACSSHVILECDCDLSTRQFIQLFALTEPQQ